MKRTKKIIALLLMLCAAMIFAGCNASNVKLPENTDAPSKETLVSEMQAAQNSASDPSETEIINYGKVEINKDFDFNAISNLVRIDIAEYGSILIELRPDVAPVTVNNFKKLVLEGFYDGLVFHRVIKDFMIEGGEQDKDSVIHDSEMIYGEFADNNFTNNLPHVKGVVSMSRKNIPDSASNGFFIVLNDAPQLDSRYAAFGYVVSGFDVLDKIESAEVDANDMPATSIVIESVQFVNPKNQ